MTIWNVGYAAEVAAALLCFVMGMLGIFWPERIDAFFAWVDRRKRRESGLPRMVARRTA